MLVIRLARTGRKKYPTYRIVAADSRRAAIGKFVMILGHYNPHTKELVIKKDETTKFINNGAQPSNAVIKLLQQEKIVVPEWVQLTTRNRPAKKSQPTVEAAPANDQAAETEAVAASSDESDQSAASVTEVASEHADAVAEKDEPTNQAETAASLAEDVSAAKATSEVAAEVASTEADAKPEPTDA
ncbi:MAG TPA: 30S ribosomal protein S16 [Candidatus Saccharimonadales bacterium]|nr:30S ribosomal protein S16 [Candidatus Saccharimonadales bacterium]